MRFFTFGTVALLGILLSGCFLWTTRSEGDSLEHRVAELESGLRQEREEMRAAAEEAQTKVEELERVLEQATAVVTRNSADLGQEVLDLRRQLSELEGQLAEARHLTEQLQHQMTEQKSELESRLQGFARRAGVDMAIDEAQIPADKGKHFELAKKAMDGGDHSTGRALLREYVRRYPSDEHAPRAQYWIGKSYLSEEKPATALGELRKVIAQSPKAEVAAEALFAMAEAFYQLHACTDSKSALEALVRNYGRSPLVPKARQKIQQVQKAPRGYCTQ